MLISDLHKLHTGEQKIIDAQTISIMITAVSIAIAAVYYMSVLRNANRTRQAQLYIQIFDKLNTKEFIRTWIEVMYHQDYKDAEEWENKYGPTTNPEAATKLFSVGMLYETIGMLVSEKLIDPGLVFAENPWAAVETWEKLEPVVRGIRKISDPKFWDSFEYLATEIRKHRQQKDFQ
jgi:hypothetical protein